jgi:hypothetical protein
LNAKTLRILEIWRSGEGVQSLNICHDSMAVEAYSREACMIDALMVANLTNQQTGAGGNLNSTFSGVSGTCYGAAQSVWTQTRRRKFGIYVLYSAMCHLRINGYKPLRAADIPFI